MMKYLLYIALFSLVIDFMYCDTVKYDWLHEVSDLKPDPRIVYGNLDNGFRYIFMPNAQLPKHFSVRLYIAAGSFMEEKEEQGLAHFLEHMAFRGIRGYPDDRMIQILQSLGVPFGTHNNGCTSFCHTIYKLDFMDNTTENLEHSLKIMAGIADGMLLDEESIKKKEIKVILAEKRDTKNVEDKCYDNYNVFAYEGLPINEHLPIGIESVIKSANAPLLRNFYKKWYRPERMVLIVVGDVDYKEVEARIKKYFSAFSGLLEAPKEPKLDILNYKQGLKCGVYQDKELSETLIEIACLKPFKSRFFNQSIKKETIYQSIAKQILNERIRVLAEQEASSFIEGKCSSGVQYNRFKESWISMKCHPQRIHETLTIAENELRRILEFGFTSQEFNRFMNDMLSQYKQDKDCQDRTSDDIIEKLLDVVVNEGICTSDEWNYEFLKDFFEKEANKEACLEVFKNSWDMNNLLIYLQTYADINPTEEQLKETYFTSKKVVLKAPEEESVELAEKKPVIIKYHFDGLGEKGSIIEQHYNAELDCYQYRFSNNVRVNLKQTHYEKEQICYRINFGNGMQEPGRKLSGPEDLANNILYCGGIGQFSKEELLEGFAEIGVEIPSFDLEKEVFAISSSIQPYDFETQMNLICGYLMEPAYRNDELVEIRKDVIN